MSDEKALRDRRGRPYTDLGYALAYLTPCCDAHAKFDQHGVLFCKSCFHPAPPWCSAGPTAVDLPGGAPPGVGPGPQSR